MTSPTMSRAIACVCLVLPIGFVFRTSSQEFASGTRDATAALLADAEDEARRGIYLLYTQTYKDRHKEKVSVHGSVYGVLHDVKLTGCDLEARIQVIDLFSGFVNDQPTGERQDLTEYSIRFRVDSELASRLSVIQARPSQLAHTMHTQCDEDPSCMFNWLRIRSARASLHERVVLNNSITFDGTVNQLLVPVSSQDAGGRLISDLRALAAARCN